MTFAYDEQLLSAVEQAMTEPDQPYSLFEPGTPEQLFEQRIARDVSEMIELGILAADPEQRALVEQQVRGIAQIRLRADLILETLKGNEAEEIRRLIRALDDPHRPGVLRPIMNRMAKHG